MSEGTTSPFSITSSETSPVLANSPLSPSPDDAASTTSKKKKKKKTKKAKSKQGGSGSDASKQHTPDTERPPVLCISRNKHWRYISSYHGPWLQLPLELLESLLVLNLDPATLASPDTSLPALPPPQSPYSNFGSQYSRTPRLRERDRAFPRLAEYTPPDSPRSTFSGGGVGYGGGYGGGGSTPYAHTHGIPLSPSAPPFPAPPPGKATPPPIDPGVFRNVTAIRRLIDEASELSVRASSGLSAAALGSMRAGGGYGGGGIGGGGMGMGGGGGSAWAAQALGLDGSGMVNNGGRNVAMSAMRVHRLRALAVQKLAAAYKADEIASSVMVMQGGSVFDDIAERVLKHDPHDIDARYVHFFHEKIPSRQLADSTTTHVLDELIAAQPHRLEFYRTRGIVHCFRDEYAPAVKDFTFALKETRAQRRARMAHHYPSSVASDGRKGGKKKKGARQKTQGQAPPNGTSSRTAETADCCAAAGGGGGGVGGAGGLGPGFAGGGDDEPLPVHPSVLPDAPDPLEPQLLFLRGAAYLQHAVHLIENAILALEGIDSAPAALDGGEPRLCYIDNGRFGGVEVGNPAGPLGRADEPKARAYEIVLGDAEFRALVFGLLRKAVRDHERFLAHFDSIEGPPPDPRAAAEMSVPMRVEMALMLTESVRPGSAASAAAGGGLADMDAVLPALFTTYHPLLVESHFSILLAQLMLGSFGELLHAFPRAAVLVDSLEGYPVFLPPRSMAQAEFVEVLERLAGGWAVGVQPHSYMRGGAAAGKLKLAIEPPPMMPATSSSVLPATPEEGWLAAEGEAANGTTHPIASSSSSSSTPIVPPSASSSSSPGPSSSSLPTPPPSSEFSEDTHAHHSAERRAVLLESLDALRILLSPVAARQAQRERDAAPSAGTGASKKPLNLNIPLHGPRVEIVLAFLAAVHLGELESVA
ncbi:hypothetical protein CONPUDRAFT_134458 [Coniophora puteana RWD-64-598 SS2]|uniref:Uncharacterized protein n=1 Tax=Coniophora puteana (strain RWD-64-598) TaxID=741705 RepID=A0A5M3N7U4_CONPW|nr:uncharacterized protein CONPUDRAFT_134458 [Coniophora puteana RWD-64-598 SS2]EIW87174.1 hypothetical protein CONPUDRAFT_134458 [Coniophora puteana RWD-64-598 SS2]